MSSGCCRPKGRSPHRVTVTSRIIPINLHFNCSCSRVAEHHSFCHIMFLRKGIYIGILAIESCTTAEYVLLNMRKKTQHFLFQSRFCKHHYIAWYGVFLLYPFRRNEANAHEGAWLEAFLFFETSLYCV